MPKNKNKISVFIVSLLTSIVIVTLSTTAAATVWPSSGALDLIKSTCSSGPSQYQELAQLKKDIVAAGSLNQARTMALTSTDGAIDALKSARTMMPFSDDLRTAETRLNDARSRIMLASSQEKVADEFDGMMLAGLDNDRAAHVNIGSGGCDYSTGELIAIVVGLILGIIPGLILLVVLC